MDTSFSAPLWAANRTALSESKVAAHLRRFPRRHRLPVLAIARVHPALADLAVSYPALLFMLAVPHRGVDAVALRRMVIAGAPLKAVARAAELPAWTRNLPPEAFARPLSHLPRHETCARQIANYLPKRARHAASWLENVIHACEFGDEAFAVWVAREYGTQKHYHFNLRRQALWAWFSLRPELEGARLGNRPWTPQIARRAANKASIDWFDRLSLHVTIAEAAVQPLWLEAKTVHGFDFVPLLSAQAIHEEARVMDNCVRGYGMDIALNMERLWSMRLNGRRAATLSVGNHRDLGLLTITEIKGPKNVKVPREVAVAAKCWIDGVDVTAIHVTERNWDAVLPDASAWIRLFKPYWKDKQRIPVWLPLIPTRSTLGGL